MKNNEDQLSESIDAILAKALRMGRDARAERLPPMPVTTLHPAPVDDRIEPFAKSVVDPAPRDAESEVGAARLASVVHEPKPDAPAPSAEETALKPSAPEMASAPESEVAGSRAGVSSRRVAVKSTRSKRSSQPVTSSLVDTGPSPDVRVPTADPVAAQPRDPSVRIKAWHVVVPALVGFLAAAGWVWESQGDPRTMSAQAPTDPTAPASPAPASPEPVAIAPKSAAPVPPERVVQAPPVVMPTAPSSSRPPNAVLGPVAGAVGDSGNRASPSATYVADAPAVTVVSDDDASVALAHELSRRSSLPLDAKVSPVASDGWRDSLASLRSSSANRVAIVRYDALRSLRDSRAPSPALEVVAPLSVERINFVVRADSPLRFIHDMEGHSIEAGSATGGRALTATTIYRELFGKAAPAGAPAAEGAEESLRRLEQGGVDVAIVIGDWRPGPGAAGLRLLRLDPSDARDQRAARTFLRLPASKDEASSVPTLGVVSFLVTARAAPPARLQHERAMGAFASTLCRQRIVGAGTPGDPATGRIDPALYFDIGLPYSESARSVFAQCAKPVSQAVAKPATS